MAADPDRQGPPAREAFARFVALATRWSDNDAYGHLNNVVYYALFDSAVNAILIEAELLDPASSPIIGLVVESSCRFYSSLTYPEPAEVGVAVEHLGRSSVRYHLAVFKAGAATAAAAGRYTHVYVERATNRPVPIPEGHRRLMESAQGPGAAPAEWLGSFRILRLCFAKIQSRGMNGDRWVETARPTRGRRSNGEGFVRFAASP